jgi:hypothetical protein
LLALPLLLVLEVVPLLALALALLVPNWRFFCCWNCLTPLKNLD